MCCLKREGGIKIRLVKHAVRCCRPFSKQRLRLIQIRLRLAWRSQLLWQLRVFCVRALGCRQQNGAWSRSRGFVKGHHYGCLYWAQMRVRDTDIKPSLCFNLFKSMYLSWSLPGKHASHACECEAVLQIAAHITSDCIFHSCPGEQSLKELNKLAHTMVTWHQYCILSS